jgi:hypothetical protein
LGRSKDIAPTVRFSEAVEDLFNDYRTNRKRTFKNTQRIVDNT